MHIKICGVETQTELEFLDRSSVDYAGLWYGIENGRWNLAIDQLRKLGELSLHRTKRVWVTVRADAQLISNVFAEVRLDALQLHGFQTPKQVAEIARVMPSRTELFKVLHVQNEKCLEERLISQYANSGVDKFIVDSYVGKAGIGSTGVRFSQAFLERLFCRNNIAAITMVAGGIDCQAVRELGSVPGLFGVDIDSSAKRDNRIDRARVTALLKSLSQANGHMPSQR
jgi:phosphoribosylanthranilate isomerase